MGFGSQFSDGPVANTPLPNGLQPVGTLRGLAAKRPPACYRNDGWLYVATDTGAAYLSIGSSWITLAGGGGGSVTSVTATSPLASSGGATPNITHNTSGVTAGSYTNSNVTVDADGHITAASNGSAGGVTSVDGIAGAVTLVAGTNIIISDNTPVAGSITITAASGGVTSVTATSPLASSGGATPNITITSPLPVLNGGTGTIGLTGHEVALWQGSSPMTGVSPGSTGQVLTSNGGIADPTFQAVQLGIPGMVQGRLTLVSGTPVAADISSTVLYFTPYRGDLLSVYNGTSWVTQSFAEVSFTVAVGSLTTNLPYDIFCYYAGPTLTLEMVAWAGPITRTTAIVLQDGVEVKSGLTNHLYLGTVAAFGTSTLADQSNYRGLWNRYNRVSRELLQIDHTNSYTYSTATTRLANASAANKIEVVTGIREDVMFLTVNALVGGTLAGGNNVGFGEDSTTAFMTADVAGGQMNVIAGGLGPLSSTLTKIPLLGYHAYNWLEQGSGSGVDTWYGDGSGARQQYSGLIGHCMA